MCVRGKTKSYTVSQLRQGVKIPLLQDEIFQERIRDLYEQFVIQPGTYVDDTAGSREHLPTGCRFEIVAPYPEMEGEGVMIITLGDDSLNSGSQLLPPDFEDFGAYEWHRLVPFNRNTTWDVPSAAMNRFAKNTIYRSDDMPPGVIHMRTLGEVTNVLGPDSELSGYDPDRPVIWITPVFSVRPYGFIPPQEIKGAMGIHTQGVSYDAAIADLALNYDGLRRYPLSFPVAVRNNYHGAEAVFENIILELPTHSILQSVDKKEWPAFLGNRNDFKRSYESGHKVAAFSLGIIHPGSGEYAAIVENTRAVLELLGPQGDDDTWAISNDEGTVQARSFSAPISSLDGTMVEEVDAGLGILDEIGDVLIMALEIGAMFFKHAAADDNFGYTASHKKSFYHLLKRDLKTMLEYAASIREGDAASSILEILQIFEDTSGKSLATAGSMTLPSLKFLGTYLGVEVGNHHHLSADEIVAIEGNFPETETVTLNVVQSAVNPEVLALAPAAKGHAESGVALPDGFGEKKSGRVTDYKQPALQNMREGYTSGTPVLFVSRLHDGSGGVSTSQKVYSMYEAAGTNGYHKVIKRTAFPLGDGTVVDLTDLPYRDKSDPYARSYFLRFTGRVTGIFDTRVHHYRGTFGDVFDYNQFKVLHGADTPASADRAYGTYTSLWTAMVPVAEAEDITSANPKDPEHKYYGFFATGLRFDIGVSWTANGVDIGQYINLPWPSSDTGLVWEGVVEIFRAPGDGGAGLLGRLPDPKIAEKQRGSKSKHSPASLVWPRIGSVVPSDPVMRRTLSLTRHVDKAKKRERIQPIRFSKHSHGQRSARPTRAAAAASSSSHPKPKASTAKGKHPSKKKAHQHAVTPARGKGKGRRRK